MPPQRCRTAPEGVVAATLMGADSAHAGTRGVGARDPSGDEERERGRGDEDLSFETRTVERRLTALPAQDGGRLGRASARRGCGEEGPESLRGLDAHVLPEDLAV